MGNVKIFAFGARPQYGSTLALAMRQETQSSEAWLVTFRPGEAGTLHRQTEEEILVALSGKGDFEADGERTPFESPCVIIVPPGVLHNIINTGREPVDVIALVPRGFKMFGADGGELPLAWA
jgi:mannose-6-phosphate isomerase-like protein (cupin superfamily)